MLFHITDFLFAFIFATVLARATGKKNIWAVFFIAGAIARPLYETIRSHMVNLNRYETLPSWANVSFAESVIAYLIVLPLIAWAGASVGNKYRKKKTA